MSRLIDADAMIEDLHTINPIYGYDVKRLEFMVNAQPTIELTQGGDLISRQDALDICNIAIDLWRCQIGEGALIAVRNKIRDLPTVDIDLSKYSDKLYKSAYERGKAEGRKMGEWIPCSERLPEYNASVLTWDGYAFCIEKRIPYIRDDDDEPIEGDWWVGDEYDDLESDCYTNLRDGAAIAWMPLPEPYCGADMRGEENEY